MNLSKRTKRELILQVNRLKTELAMLGQRDAHGEANSLSLLETQERFELFFGHASLGFAIIDQAMRYVMVNPAMAALNGHPIEEHAGMPVQSINPIASQYGLPIVRTVFDTDTPSLDNEIVLPVKQNEMDISRHFRISAFPIHYGEDYPVCVGIIVEDTTARRFVEDRLYRQEAKYRQIVELSNEGIWGIDSDLKITFVNRRMAEMLGYSQDELIGRVVMTLMHESDLPDHSKRLDSRRGGLSEQFERRFITKSGEVRYMYVSATPILSEDGTFLGSFAMTTDITERKVSENALRNLETSYRMFLDASPDMVLTKDSAGHYLFANKKLLNFMHCTASELIGKTDYDLLPLQLAEQCANSDRAVMQQNEMVRVDEIIDDRIVETIKFPFQFADGSMGLGGYIRDITEKRREDSERQFFEMRRTHAQKLESLGILAGGIAHDFNNILAAILNNAEYALLELGDNNPVSNCIQEILTSTHRAAELSRQMLAYSGKAPFSLAAVDLNEMITSLGSLIQASIPKKIGIKFRLTEERLLIHADQTQIKQIILNLVTNAWESYEDRSGQVVVTTGIQFLSNSGHAQDVHKEPIAEGNYVFVRIEDSGCGIPESMLSRIFDPFFSSKFTGRGMGLAVVQGIVRSHKGSIEVESHANTGTKVTVYLPAQVEARESHALERSESHIVNRSGFVLLVDDELAILKIGKRILERIGYQVMVATNGKEALDIFTTHRNTIALIILDLTMPVMNGEETLLEIRKTAPNIPVILSSGFNESEMARFGHTKVTAFIQKPYLASSLQKILDSLLDPSV